MRAFVCSLLLLGMAAAPATASAARFKLTSPDIKPGGKIAQTFVFKGAGCTGENISPALAWTGAPAGTQGYVLTVYDPDAPTGSGFWHWIMYDIPASVTSLPQGAGAPDKQPAGAMQAVNDYGITGYGGPCPPPGDRPHHYIFTIYAVKTAKLDAPAGATNAVVRFLTHFQTIGKATFTARYGH